MLSRYYDTIRTPVFDIFDTLNAFGELNAHSSHHRFDAIDDEGIKIELPGVKQSEVDVTVEGRILKVSGKSRHGKEFTYRYSLKDSVDDSLITASLQDGLLSITLPKKKESSTRKISVTG